ncbi:MAG: bifunctional proline dehydrogenase/L-glutamate gamma-semialdehyde dehydrogenase PutA, partial [Pseudomonadales bacterium]
IGEQVDSAAPILQRPSISVKLSALYPRYEYSQQQRAIEVLSHRLLELAQRAKQVGICLTVDAEEADRLTLSLSIFEQVFLHPSLRSWAGLGLAVQAYQKRALPVLKFLQQLAQQGERRIPVRLVKGAYWDTEIKRAQQQGLSDYPVFSRKNNTDVSYLACAQLLLAENQWLYPQFATHNAYTVASILVKAEGCDYEFQRLHGMGEALYEKLLDEDRVDQSAETVGGKVRCRVYAPVGAHEELLPYLVRRLLENGANTSFVNQLAHPEQSLDELTMNPCQLAKNLKGDLRHPDIVVPAEIFGAERINSAGVNFADANELGALLERMNEAADKSFESRPLIDGQDVTTDVLGVVNPANTNEVIGVSGLLGAEQKGDIETALTVAYQSWPQWNATPVKERAAILFAAADLFEAEAADLIALCVKEAGKTIRDSHAEIREAVDFLRYYGQLAVAQMERPIALTSFAGESNELSLQGRGVFVCISPWNFPVAIFTGQIAAALVTGNCVLAKSASLTCLTARRVIDLLFQAGVPRSVLHYLPCDANLLSSAVLADKRVVGVAFTGSTDAARHINQRLAQRDGAIASLIAETGGQNVLVADSSAQPEQLITDVMRSAFNSAGQRCSALRILYVQEEISERVIELLKGAMDQLVIADPLDIATDIGPVISGEAQGKLEQHVACWQKKSAVLHRCRLPKDNNAGYFFAPALIEIDSIEQLSQEIFGPILHIVRYKKADFDAVLEAVNGAGYGLTFGLHSRLDQRTELIRQRVRAGNLYVNRDIIGAVVGVQPFGGQGLSGTGPKAGGPHYLLRFTAEQTCTVNTAAAGGDAALLSQTK